MVMGAHIFEEYQCVRLKEAQSGKDVFDVNVIHQLPAGQIGTIVHVYSEGAAFMVEFILGERGEDGIIQDPSYTTLDLRSDQISPC